MKSVNPDTGKVVKEIPTLTTEEIAAKIERSWSAFQKHRQSSIESRKEKFTKLAKIFEERLDKYSQVLILETGKTKKEANAEVTKCAKHCKWIVDNLDQIIKQDSKETEATKSYIDYQPLGVIFFVTPYNFPLWLVLKGAGPAIAVGNTVVNKVPSQCPQTGLALEEAFRDAGFDQGEYQFLAIGREHSEFVIAHRNVRGVSFTGSTNGGGEIASLAGKYCKKSIMELGGSDPFLILRDADLDQAVEVAIKSRLRHSGQACNCAKRFIVDETVYDKFRDKLVEKVKKMKVGSPSEEDTEIGPLGSKKIADQLRSQFEAGVKQGAKVFIGEENLKDEKLKNSFYFHPVICEVRPDNILFQEETFGPIFAMTSFKDEEEAIKIANNSEYGLSGAIVTKDLERAEKLAKCLEVGSVYINAPVASDSRFPSGGVKSSGYGRECGVVGAREFTNAKTVWVK